MTDSEKDSTQNWWQCAQAKGANYLRIVKSGRFYALEACKHGTKARIAQKSIGTTNEKVAQITRSRLLITQQSNEPDVVVEQYIQHLLRTANLCIGKKGCERLYVSRVKTAKTNASRLKVHLVAFCKDNRIHDIRDLYQGDTIGQYIVYLKETVVGISTAKAIIKTTKAFLHWYDITKKVHLINSDYIAAFSESSSILGHKKRTEKPFLDDEQCKQILAAKAVNYELRARVIAHMVGGLRDIEIQGLRWKDLNAKEGWLNVINAKGAIARYAQYPSAMQEAFLDIQRNRTHNILGNDYVFTQSSYSKRNEEVKAFVRKVTGVIGNDYAGNCLRRTGCACIQNKHPGLGDKQLGHAVNSRVTEMYYTNPRDFRNINKFWDDLWKEVKEQGLVSVNLSDNLSNVIRISA